MEIRFPGGMAVEAVHKGYTIRTDHPVAEGGGGSAPSPFDLFLASIGTCAGHYALAFCRERKIDPAGLKADLSFERDPEKKMIVKVWILLTLPPGFPEKYEDAIVRAVEQCTVKRHLGEPPEFEIMTRPSAPG